MPGYIKVDGSQRPVAAPYVKVDGTWKPVALGYIKVDGNWRIWHSAEIVDNFNRADSPTLGTASNTFSQWTELSGNWAIQNNRAYHDTSAGPSIATTPLYKASFDYRVQIDTPDGPGLGVAFWVQDANNWYAAIPGVRQQDNAAYYYCPSGYTLSGTTCSRTTVETVLYEADTVVDPAPYEEIIFGCPATYQSYNGTCRKVVDSFVQVIDATCTSTTTYTCPSGYSGPSATNRCTKTLYAYSTTLTESIGCVDSSICGRVGGSCGGSCTGGCRCTTSTTVCKCYSGGPTVSCGSVCGTDIIFATPKPITSCTCPDGYYRDGTDCRRVVYEYDYTDQIEIDRYTVDPDPYVVPGRGYYCSSGVAPTGNQCITTTYTSATYVPPSTSYPSVIRIYRNLAGIVTEVFSQDVSSDPQSLEVSTSGTNITVSLYSGAGLSGSRIASVVHSAVAPIRTRGVGIAKNGAQPSRNGTSVDNFRAE